MSKFSLRTLPVAMLMTTAMSWGLPLHAADLDVGVSAKPKFSTGPGNAAAATDANVRANVQKGASANAQKGAQHDNKGRSADALSAVTEGKAQEGAASVGATVREAVSVDGQARAPGRTGSN